MIIYNSLILDTPDSVLVGARDLRVESRKASKLFQLCEVLR